MIVAASPGTRALCSGSLMVHTPACSFPYVLSPSQQLCSSREAEAQRTQSFLDRAGEVPFLTSFGVRRGSRLLLFFPLLLVLVCPATGCSLPKVVWEIPFQFPLHHLHFDHLPITLPQAHSLATMPSCIPPRPH